MTEKIHAALDKHFQKHRLIFWYDEGGARRDIFQSYEGDGIRKAEVANDEFAVKYRILRAEGDDKFLVYVPGERPKDETNWFLDLILSGFVFATDEVAWIVQELELDPSLEDVVAEHLSFFENKKERLDPLRVLLGKHPSKPAPDRLRRLMLSVLLGDTKAEREEERDLKNILFRMFSSLSAPETSRPDYTERIRRYGLEDFFWMEVEKQYGFKAASPSLETFLAALFYKALELSLKTRSDGQARQAFTFLDEWRNSINYVEAYALLSERYARELNVKQILQDKKLDELFGNDLFKEVDRIIVHKLTEMAVSGTLNAQEALQRITERKGSYWVKSDTERKVMRFYDCLASYFRFQQEIGSLEEYPSDIRAFWDLYSRSYYRVDTEYRLFIEQLLEISQRELLTPLLDKIEKVYVNTYLSGLSAAWHEVLTDFSVFSTGDFPRQADFFKRYVQPYLQQGKIVFVILSDALRYDIGAELAGLLERQNRVQVELEPIAACVPTYTQIGMAALLPHRSLGLDPKSGNAVIDGKKVAGLEGRNTVLEDYAKKAGNGLKAKAIDARAFMDISPVQQEEEIRGFGCVYLYSNHIDAIGDSAKTELSLPDAARREIEFLCSLVKKITNLNRTHILITADHGFLYQYGAVEESDFIAVQESAGELRRDRRFLLGTHLPDDPRLLGVTAEQAGLAGDFEISLVKGVSRIRKSGGGSRYVHGGASLHEICIPLLKIRKVREDDLRPVHFVVLTRVTDITTNSISLKFLQVDPVGAKVLPRHIAARFESDDGKTVLSNQRDLVFESSDENEQNRTLSADFVFNGDASKFNGKIVHLAFFENKMGVTVPVEERKAFRFRTAFTPDF